MCRKTNKYCTSGWVRGQPSPAQPTALANENCLARPASSSPVRHSPGLFLVKGPHSPAAPSLRTCYPESDGELWGGSRPLSLLLVPHCQLVRRRTNKYKKSLSITTSSTMGVGPTTRQDGPFLSFLPTPAAACLHACRLHMLLHVYVYVDNIHDGKKWERHACSRVMMPGSSWACVGTAPRCCAGKRWRWGQRNLRYVVVQ